MMGSRVMPAEFVPVEEDNSDAHCKLPSQRRRDYTNERQMDQARHAQSVARRQLNGLSFALRHRYPGGFLGGKADEEAAESAARAQQQEQERAQVHWEQRRQWTQANNVKDPASGMTLLWHQGQGSGTELGGAKKLFQSKARVGQPQKTDLAALVNKPPPRHDSARAAQLRFEDTRGKGFDIISGVALKD